MNRCRRSKRRVQRQIAKRGGPGEQFTRDQREFFEAYRRYEEWERGVHERVVAHWRRALSAKA